MTDAEADFQWKYEQSLAMLKSFFPKQVVLYIPDIANVMSRSDDSVWKAIARNALPVKPYFGRLGIGIPELARIIARGDDVDEKREQPRKKVATSEAAQPKATTTKTSEPRESNSKPMKPQRRTTRQPSEPPTILAYPTPRLRSMVSMITATRRQADFYTELANELEKERASAQTDRLKKRVAKNRRAKNFPPLDPRNVEGA